MKKLAIIFAVFIISATFTSKVATAQWGGGGIKGGVTMSNLYIDEDDMEAESARWGWHAGVHAQMMFTDFFGLQPEVLYTTKGTRARYAGAVNQTINYKLSYLDFPLLMVFRPVEMFDILAGPYIGLMLESNINYSGTVEGQPDLNREHFKPLDYGFAVGFAFNFYTVKLGFRYNMGFERLADSSASRLLLGDSKNAYGQAYVALNLNRRYR